MDKELDMHQKKVLVYIFFVGIILGIPIGYFIFSWVKTDEQKLDECFQILDKTVIHDVGKAEIEKIVNQSSPLGKDPKRLTQIADMITRNFTDPNWDYQKNEKYFCYYPNDPIPYNYCLLVGQDNLTSLIGLPLQKATFMVDKLGHIRQYVGITFSTDPYWIMFQKTGECQELSVLFNHTANQSGFITRIVRSGGIAHWWNEVCIDGEWKFFDVQRYGEMKKSNDSSYWFGNTSDYANKMGFNLCNITKSRVYVYDKQSDSDGEDITAAYDPKNFCSH